MGQAFITRRGGSVKIKKITNYTPNDVCGLNIYDEFVISPSYFEEYGTYILNLNFKNTNKTGDNLKSVCATAIINNDKGTIKVGEIARYPEWHYVRTISYADSGLKVALESAYDYIVDDDMHIEYDNYVWDMEAYVIKLS